VRRPRFRRPSPAMAVALLALLVALGGTAAAASVVLIRSSKQVAKGAISLSDLSASAQKSLRGKGGPAGPAGPAGLTGAAGVAGAAGAAGQRGATGPAGPTAAASASQDPADIALTNLPQTVLDLSSGTHTGPITVGFNARLVINATLDIYATAAGTQSSTCQLLLIPSGGGGQQAGQYSYSDPAGSGTDTEVPLLATVDVAPGTYDVRAQCWTLGAASFDRGDLSVIAVAR